jgi:hypothetical protein
VIVPYASQVKVADPLTPFWSAAVTVTLYWPPVLGVPETTPPALIASPGGRPAALKVNVSPGVPFTALSCTGIMGLPTGSDCV